MKAEDEIEVLKWRLSIVEGAVSWCTNITQSKVIASIASLASKGRSLGSLKGRMKSFVKKSFSRRNDG
jgi:hypothetical protein